MTTIWVAQTRDETTYHDTQAAAEQWARNHNTAIRNRGYNLDHQAIAYPTTVEPAPRGNDYWNRTRKAVA